VHRLHYTQVVPRAKLQVGSMPRAAKELGLHGETCRVHVHIDVRGRVTSVRVGGCPAVFHAQLESHARRWRFQPAEVDGQKVPAEFIQPVRYELR